MLLPFAWDESGLWYMAATVIAIIPAIWKLSDHDPWATAAWLLSPLTLGMFWQRNIDWMIVVGLAVTPAWAWMFLPAKLHLGIAALIANVRHDWNARALAILAIVATGTTLMVFDRDSARLLAGDWNGATLWPWTIAPGLLIAWLYPGPVGLVAASCFLFPYIGKYSFALATLPLLKRRRWMIVCSLLAWAAIGVML